MNFDVRINRLTPGDSNVKAVASATFDNCFAVRNIKIMEGSKGLFVSMPSYKAQDGSYHDICFPTTAEFRQTLNDAVANAYKQAIAQLQEQKNVDFTQAAQTDDSPAAAMKMSM